MRKKVKILYNVQFKMVVFNLEPICNIKLQKNIEVLNRQLCLPSAGDIEINNHILFLLSWVLQRAGYSFSGKLEGALTNLVILVFSALNILSQAFFQTLAGNLYYCTFFLSRRIGILFFEILCLCLFSG